MKPGPLNQRDWPRLYSTLNATIHSEQSTLMPLWRIWSSYQSEWWLYHTTFHYIPLHISPSHWNPRTKLVGLQEGVIRNMLAKVWEKLCSVFWLVKSSKVTDCSMMTKLIGWSHTVYQMKGHFSSNKMIYFVRLKFFQLESYGTMNSNWYALA